MSLGTELSTAYQGILDKPIQQQMPRQQQQNTPVKKILQEMPSKPTPVQPSPIMENKQRKDILKTVMLSTIILFAVSTHSLVEYVIKDLSASFLLSFKQEIGARLLYPLMVFLLLYMIKIVWV